MKSAFLLVVAAAAIFVASCGDEPANPTNPNPTIGKVLVTSVTPATAGSGDTLTISGRNFGVNTADITVLLDSVALSPVFLSDSIIRIIIPTTLSDKTYAITVRKKTELTTGGNIVINNSMIILSVQPAKAWRGDTVTITGKRFGNTIADITVLFDSLSTKPFALSDTIIKVIVPQTVTGKMGGGKVQSISSGINQSASKSYSVVIRKGGKSVKAAQQIVLGNNWFLYRTAHVDIQISGITYKKSSYSQGFLGGPPPTPTTSYDTVIGPLKRIEILSQCKSETGTGCYQLFTPPAIKVCCGHNGYGGIIDAAPDTAAKIIPQLFAKFNDNTTKGSGHYSTSKSYSFTVSLQDARYSEFDGGITIVYTGNQITDKMIVSYQESNSTHSTSSGLSTSSQSSDTFIPSGTYAPDDYIKITLYR
jgi:phage-related protein